MTASSPAGPSWAQANTFEIVTDSLNEALERRVAALEHAVCSASARRRLRYQIRSSNRLFAWAGPDFWTRRLEATTSQWLNEDLTGHSRTGA